MSSTTDAPSVLIAGAGPTGLILALALLQNGISVRIVEKDTAFHVGQRGAGIQPRTLELLHFLGLLPEFMEQSIYNTPVAIYKMPEGREIEKVINMTPVLEPTPDVPFRRPRLIGQSHNEAIVRGHLAKYNTHVELGVELADFTQDSDGVTATLVHHTKEGKEEKEALRVKYLVGAEGARSFVRKHLGLTFLGETRESTRILLVDVPIKGINTDYWHQWGGMTTKTVWIRRTEHPGVFNIMIGGNEVDTGALQSDKSAVFQFIRDVTGRQELEFGEPIWISEFRPNIRMVNKFGEGRAFLVGDAAHVHSPTGGQGLNTGAQDCINLAWKLALVLKNQAPASLLETYSAERLPVVKDMLFRTTELLEKTVRSTAGGSDTSYVDRPKMLHQLGVNYRWSPIVVDEQPAAHEEVSGAYGTEDPSVLRAGDRAPEAPCLAAVGAMRGTTSLFNIFKPMRHTALLFTADVATAKAVVEALEIAPAGTFHTVLVLPKGHDADVAVLKAAGVDEAVVDNEGHAHRFYPPAATGFHTIIVRPDGIVGAVTKSVESVKKYLGGVFGV